MATFVFVRGFTLVQIVIFLTHVWALFAKITGNVKSMKENLFVFVMEIGLVHLAVFPSQKVRENLKILTANRVKIVFRLIKNY